MAAEREKLLKQKGELKREHYKAAELSKELRQALQDVDSQLLELEKAEIKELLKADKPEAADAS